VNDKVNLVVLAALLMIVSPAFGQQTPPGTDQQPGDIYFFIRYDVAAATSHVSQSLPADWPTHFQPPAGSMMTKNNDSPWFGEIGIGVGPKWDLPTGEIAVLIFYNFIGLSSMQKRFYTLRRPVAGVELDWGDPVRLQATTIQKTSPEFGLAYTWRRLTVHPSLQTYRLLREDYIGESCDGCGYGSSLSTITNLGSGLGTRMDVQFRIDPQAFLGNSFDPWNTAAVGVFYERNGGKTWQFGVSLQVGMELITRHRRTQ
jgi:hypothetical protein